MDLRSIINSDISSAPQTSREPSAYDPPVNSIADRRSTRNYESPVSPIQTGPHSRPPPPADFRSPGAASGYAAPHSPYQASSPTSALAGGQYSFPALSSSYSTGQGRYHAVSRDSPSIMVPSNQTSQLLYGPPSATSSASPVPTSANSHHHNQPYTPYQTQQSPTLASPPIGQAPHLNHESPRSFHSHSYAHPHSFSSHPSQPSTPLAPPSAYIPTPKAYPPGPSTSWSHQPHMSASTSGTPNTVTQDVYSTSKSTYPKDADKGTDEANGHGSSHASDAAQASGGSQHYLQVERHRSLSLSPKTKMPDSDRPDGVEEDKWNGQVTPAKRKHLHASDDEQSKDEPSSFGNDFCADILGKGPSDPPSKPSPANQSSVNGVNHHQASGPPTKMGAGTSRPYFDPIQSDRDEHRRRTSSTSEAKQRSAESTHMITTEPEQMNSLPPAVTPAAYQHPVPPPSSSDRESPVPRVSPSKQASEVTASPLTAQPPLTVPTTNVKVEPQEQTNNANKSSVSPQRPAKKRTRYDEPPIFARKASRSTSSSPVVLNRRHLGQGASVTSAGPVKSEQSKDGGTVSSAQPVDSQSVLPDRHNTSPFAHEGPSVTLPQGQPALMDDGPLGPWEPSITNVIPSEEITRKIMDFLFLEVVERKDVDDGPIPGVQLEIEAKLGQLIDKNTNERVRLPVLTECIFNKDHPSWRTSFRSSMTEVSLSLSKSPLFLSFSRHI